MWQVMLYTIGVAIALSLAGYCEERLAIMRDLPRRWVWPLTMVLSIAWAVAGILWVGPAVRSSPDLPVVAAAQAPLVSPDTTSSAVLSDAIALLTPVAAHDTMSVRWNPPSDRTLLTAWAAASGLLLSYFLGANALLRRRALRWRRETVLGREVLVSEATGPALLGTWRPRIVVPRWFMQESPATQALILQHEEQHVTARDPLLLQVAMLIAVAAPWNLPLWWQLRRLRRAIEMDCDARVLRRGVEPAAYGEVLLAVTRRISTQPRGMVAMGAPVSSLELRIRNLAPDPSRHSIWRAAQAMLVWAVGIGAAIALEAPPLPERTATPQQPRSQQPLIVPPAQPAAVPEARTEAQPRPSRTAAELPRLLPPMIVPPPNRREVIERALVERHPELVSGPERDGNAFVTMVLGTDGMVASSTMRFVEAGDRAGLEAANAENRFSGHLLLGRGWQIADGAKLNSLVRVSYTSELDRPPAKGEPPRAGSFLRADLMRVIEHHLPGALDVTHTKQRGTPWLILSHDGRVLRSGYFRSWSPASLQAEYPEGRLKQVTMVGGIGGSDPRQTMLIALAWAAP
jgi:beta-lactamase regulating signal transducer with metallopeptidase domain